MPFGGTLLGGNEKKPEVAEHIKNVALSPKF